MELTRAYKAARQRGAKAGAAIVQARANLARLAKAEVHKAEARQEMAEAREIDSRRYAPAMEAARAMVQKVESEWRNAYRLTTPRESVSVALNKPFPLDSSTLGQWIENPESAFRFVGLSSDIAPDRDRTRGFFMDSSQDVIARGVVYQMRPTREGFARFIPAIPDPSNSESDGRGPAIFVMGGIVTADSRDEDDAESAREDAARYAMQCAESYAEAEREYDEAWQAGASARQALEDAREAREEFLALRREAKEAREDGVARPVLCAALRREAESLAERWQAGKRKAEELRESIWDKRLAEAFKEGLAG